MSAPSADGRARSDPGTTHRLVRSSAVVGVGTALSRLTGFARIAAIAYALGVTRLTGVYSYANETPNIFYELLLGGILTATLLPLFVRQLAEDDDDRGTDAIVTVAVVGLLVATALGIALAPWIVRIYTLKVHGPSADAQRELATAWLRCFMPQIFFYGVTALASALLNARRRFAAAAFAPILNNLVVIGLFLALPHVATGPLTVDRVLHDRGLLLLMGLGTTAGIAAMTLALWPAVVRAGVRIRPLFAWRHTAVRSMVRLSGWTVGYVVANQVSLWVVMVLANGTAGGPFVYMSAYAFFQLPHGLFAVSITTTMQPELARAYAEGDRAGQRELFARGFRLIAVLMVTAAALYVGLSQPIVTVLLQRGAFDATAAGRVADTLVGFAVGLPAFSLYLYTLRAFYAMPDTRVPFYVNCLENVCNIGAALVLYAWIGVPGLALAFSVAYAVTVLVAVALIARRLGGLRGLGLVPTFARALAAGGAGGASAWLLAAVLGGDTWSRSLLGGVVGGVVGLGVAVVGLRLLGVREVDDLRGAFGRGARRGATVQP